ncbi:MAG TPA: hypothetical protein VGX76_05100, partial [Pirellulales bacterium]|nr:hypothetical protein [Pirellulales bacterium]
DGGQKLFEALLQHGFDVTTVFWLKAIDHKWRFHIVSPIVDAEGTMQAYKRLHPIIWGMPQPFSIDPLSIKLIGPTNPIARDVIAAHGLLRVPPTQAIRWPGIQLGQVAIDGAYLYPLPAPTPTP